MQRVAFLTSANMLAEHPERRDDHWELDAEFVPMRAACAERGIALELAVWDDPEFDPSACAAAVIGTTWDYTSRPDEFLAALARIEQAVPLFNPLEVVRWNLDKKYLADLERRGAPIVPTLWLERADSERIAAAFDELSSDEIVIKPVIGASAWRQVRLARGAQMPAKDALPPAGALVQPFLRAAAEEGEYSFVFMDGELSHCALKVPARGDYRVQSMYGGRESVHAPSRADAALARSVLAAVDARLLYARVDMVRGPSGELLLMELELIEPYLYPEQGPRLGANFADALVRLLR